MSTHKHIDIISSLEVITVLNDKFIKTYSSAGPWQKTCLKGQMSEGMSAVILTVKPGSFYGE